MSLDYQTVGCTDVRRVVPEAELEQLQALILELTAQWLEPESEERSLSERLRMPFRRAPNQDDLARLMNTVQSSPEFARVTALPEVARCFSEVFDGEEAEPFPICRFRAQIPGIARSSFGWHQDEGTWYAAPVKSLAARSPATLWLSVNGADAENSIELIPGSHRLGLVDHRYRDGQGYFRAVVPSDVERSDRRRVAAQPGEGIFFHPLLFHRSVPAAAGPPRYSVDVRYCPVGGARVRHRVDWRLRLRRWLA